MNNTVLKIIAGLLALGSIVVAILGLRLSQQPAKPAPEPVAAPASVPTDMVVVAVKAIKAGQIMGASDTGLKGVVAPAQGAFRQPPELSGKMAAQDIAIGTVITRDMLGADSMANLLSPGERAVAVHVDEVIGVGGYAKPGDHVDVLYFVPANKETGEHAIAQTVLHGARVLALGDTTQMDQDEARYAEQGNGDAVAKLAAKETKDLKERKNTLRSAVLAIKAADATRLMLAAGTGQLRLALTPPTPVDTVTAPAQARAANASADRLDLATLLQSATPLSANQALPRLPNAEGGIIIQEGSKERRITQNETSTQP
ncbi:MAG: Flp pilus assembly protein CpaB [Aquabacterium sp.]